VKSSILLACAWFKLQVYENLEAGELLKKSDAERTPKHGKLRRSHSTGVAGHGSIVVDQKQPWKLWAKRPC